MRTIWRRLGRLAVASWVVLGFACSPGGDQGDLVDELAQAVLSQLDGEIRLPGLLEPVEVKRDKWGIPHIYAGNMDDLFFAQGFVTAQDRLWQMDMWRRVSEGTVAEIAGPEWLAHDRLVRLLMFRGPFDDQEWTMYHPEAKRIFTAFAHGVNAYIDHVGDGLPIEYQLTGLRPKRWTPETSLLRARVGPAAAAASRKLLLAMAVDELGVEEANRRDAPVPWNELRIPEGLDVSLVTREALAPLQGNRYGAFPQPELLPRFRDLAGSMAAGNLGAVEEWPGSNNWAVQGRLTASGKPMLSADPHRQVTNPALRYVVHLNAPGWNVAGMTEPALPGVYVGHNGYVAWGRTATGNDMFDVFVEEVNPENRYEVLYRGRWEPLERVVDTIFVKDGPSQVMEIKFSRHGPIFYEDTINHRAYALNSPLRFRGSAEYIGAFNLAQARSAEACLSERVPLMPQTNLVCADSHGNIAWQNAAMQPDRTPGWYGRLPVPGTGRYEWKGFRSDLPSTYNPDSGWIATANESIQPPGFYPPLYFRPRNDRRKNRIADVLSSGSNFTEEDFKRLQHDVLNTEALEMQPFFRGWTADDPEIERARQMISGWDALMKRESGAAALYMAWRAQIERDTLAAAGEANRRRLITEALEMAIDSLRMSQGQDWLEWRWGRIHRFDFPHPLVSAFDLPSIERSGGAGTVNATGAVYRQIVDFSDLDNSVMTMAPGQSGQPGSPFYGNLLELYANETYIPLGFTRAAVAGTVAHRLTLTPHR